MTRDSFEPEKNKTGIRDLLARRSRNRVLNDHLRRTLSGGVVVISYGVNCLGPQSLAVILREMREFTKFNMHNDPYGEHDFGTLFHRGERLFWKIQYYDKTMEGGSPDPNDPDVTTRVMTIMLASEY